MDYETVLEEQMDAMDLSELEDSLADAAQQSGVLKDLSVEDLVDRLLNGQAILDSDQILENLKNLFLLEVKSSLMLGCEILAVCILSLIHIYVVDGEYSEDDVVSMLEAGQESGELKEEGKKMITSIFAFDDMLAYEVMTPRTDVFCIDINAPTEDYIDEMMELRYSRIPVYEDDSDNIIGILYIKDYLIKAKEAGFENVDFRDILRKPYFVPETKNIDSLFAELKTTKQHNAILIDE